MHGRPSKIISQILLFCSNGANPSPCPLFFDSCVVASLLLRDDDSPVDSNGIGATFLPCDHDDDASPHLVSSDDTRICDRSVDPTDVMVGPRHMHWTGMWRAILANLANLEKLRTSAP